MTRPPPGRRASRCGSACYGRKKKLDSEGKVVYYGWMLVKQKKKRLLLSMSNDGVVVIAEVAREAEEQKKSKSYWLREYYISEDCLQANLERGGFTDVSSKLNYDGRIFALAGDL